MRQNYLENLPPALSHARRLSVPPAAVLRATVRSLPTAEAGVVDAAVYQLGDESRIQVDGITVPIDEEAEAAWCEFITDVSLGHIKPGAARRFLALMPGAFTFAQ